MRCYKGVRMMSLERMLNKAQTNYEMVRDWLYIKQRGDSLVDYFLENNYKSIAIYGGGDLGQLLLQELEESAIKVEVIFDNNAKEIYLEGKVEKYIPHQISAQCLVITAVFDIARIIELIRNNNPEIPIVSLREIISTIC